MADLCSILGKVRMESMSSVATAKGAFVSDIASVHSRSTFQLEIFSSCCIGRVCTVALIPTTEDSELYSPANFSPVELFTQSMSNDTLHFVLKTIVTGSDRKGEATAIIGQCEKKIASLPGIASECKFILRSAKEEAIDVGMFYCKISQQPVDTSDSDDGDSVESELLDKKNGSVFDDIVSRLKNQGSNYPLYNHDSKI